MSEVRLVGGAVLTPDGMLAEGEVAFDSVTGVIGHVGEIRGPRGSGDVDTRGRLVMPGLVNAHTHAGMGVLRGYSDDEELHTWLGHMRAIELRMTADDIRAGLRLAMAEMMRTGTVGFLDMFEWTPALLATVVEAGLRVNAAPTVFDEASVPFPRAATATGAQILDRTPALGAEFAGESLVTVSYGLHAPYTCPPELIREVARRRRSDGLGVQIHLAETMREVQDARARFGAGPVAHVAGLGLMQGRVHVAHAVHPQEGDQDLLAADGVTVAHNPVSNLKLAAGIAPVPRYLAAGVTVGLGTDSVASNNTLDLFEEIKTAVLIQRGISQDAGIISAATVLDMATAGGAAALDQGLSGRLAVGEQADLVLLDTSGTTATPFTDGISFACYAARGSDVTDVWIAGRQVVADRRCTTIDEEAARAEVAERAQRLRGELADSDPRPRR